MKPPSEEEPERALFFRGRLMKVPFIVRTHVQHGLWYKGRYRSHTTLIVNHWTGAENAPHAVFRNLLEHEEDGRTVPLSVHFVIDHEGKIYQFADTEQRCSHTGTEANGYSIGIEHICRGTNFKVPSKGVVRTRKTASVNGRKVTFDALTDAQLGASVALNRALCALYDLPFKVPLNSAGRIMSTAFGALDTVRFQGCVEHLHLKPGKPDCALMVMQAIHEADDDPGAFRRTRAPDAA